MRHFSQSRSDSTQDRVSFDELLFYQTTDNLESRYKGIR